MENYEILDIMLRTAYKNAEQDSNRLGIHLTQSELKDILPSITEIEIKGYRQKLVDDGFLQKYNEEKVSTLTKQGIYFFLNGGYAAKHKEKELADEMIRSSIRTNKSVYVFGAITVIVSILTLTVAYLDYRKYSNETKHPHENCIFDNKSAPKK
jgi:hypothetical protein